MSERFDRAVNAVIAVSTVAAVAIMLQRTVLPRGGSSVAADSLVRLPSKNFALLTQSGFRRGSPSSPATIVEFIDMECAFCRRYHDEVIKPALVEFGDSLSIVHVHFPLPNHRFARIAAQAVECAGEQSRHAEMVDALFAKQDSLGLLSWGRFGLDAGVRDTSSLK